MLVFDLMRKTTSPKKPHDHEGREEAEEEVQPIHRRTGEEEEAEIAREDLEDDDDDDVSEDDADDHTMEKLDEDDLANMQGPDA